MIIQDNIKTVRKADMNDIEWTVLQLSSEVPDSKAEFRKEWFTVVSIDDKSALLAPATPPESVSKAQ